MIKKVLLLSLFLALALTLSVAAYDIQGGTVITESSVNLRQGPSTDDEVMDKLSTGTRVAVLDQSDVWYKVAFGGAIGYLHSDYVETQPIMNIRPGGAKITTSVLNLREKPSTDSEVIQRLSEGAVANIIGINTGWFKVETDSGKTGYIHPDYVDVVPYTLSAHTTAGTGASSTGASVVVNTENLSETRKAILEYAASFLGVRYKYGGSSPSGFDCSGFTSYVYAHFDIKLSRSSADQYKSSNVKKISREELQPGDLVFWSNGKKGVVGHVGIYVGNNEFIHSPSPGGVVEYESMDSSYYSKRFIGCGTVLG